MRPVLFRVRGIPVRSYPVMLYVGLVAGLWCAAAAASIDAPRVVLALWILLLPALAGARLFYAAGHWRLYRRNPRRIVARNQGGAAQYGALAVALPLSVPLAAALRLPLGAFWDAAVFALLPAMIFGRIGCLLNGCCAGRAFRVPTQWLEAGWAAVLLIFAAAFRQALPFPGALFWTVAAGYAAGRLALESTRDEAAGRFTVHHGVSSVLILLALAALAFRWPKS